MHIATFSTIDFKLASDTSSLDKLLTASPHGTLEMEAKLPLLSLQTTQRGLIPQNGQTLCQQFLCKWHNGLVQNFAYNEPRRWYQENIETIIMSQSWFQSASTLCFNTWSSSTHGKKSTIKKQPKPIVNTWTSLVKSQKTRIIRLHFESFQSLTIRWIGYLSWQIKHEKFHCLWEFRTK